MNRLFQIILLITLLWLSQSCKHDTTDTPVVTPTQDLTVSKKDVFQYEILTFKSDSTVIYNANVYDAEIGGTKLKIGRVDNNFSFVMPSVDAGPQTLEVLIEKKKLRIAYTVKQAQQVSDVNGYTNKYLTTVDSIVANYSRLLIKGTIRNGSAINQENINLLRSQLQKLQQEWAKASDVDKKTFANILYVNDVLIGLSNLRSGGRLAIPSQPQDGCAVRFDTEVVFQLAKILSIASFGSLLYAVPGAQLLGIGLTIVVAKELIDLQSYMIANYDCPAILDGNTEINSSAPGGRLKASTLTVINDQPTAIIFQANYRSLQAKDQSSSFKVRSRIISSITTFKDIWEAAQKFFISKLAGQPLDINEIKITNQVLPVSPELLAISSVSDPSVRLKSAIASKEKLIVAFTTDKPGITKFTFDVTYDNPGVAKSTTTFDAEIKKTKEEIASVKIDPAPATIAKGESITLTATALTKDQKLVAIEDSRWQWEAVGTVPFTIMASGKDVIVKGIQSGEGMIKLTERNTGFEKTSLIKILDSGQYSMAYSQKGQILDKINKDVFINTSVFTNSGKLYYKPDGSIDYSASFILDKNGEVRIDASSNNEGRIVIDQLPNKVGTYKLSSNLTSGPRMFVYNDVYYNIPTVSGSINSHRAYESSTNESMGDIVISSISENEIVGTFKCKLHWQSNVGVFSYVFGYDITVEGNFRLHKYEQF